VAAGCALVWAVGEFAGEVAAGARAAGLADARARAFAGQEELVAAARESLRPDDVVLVKGSRSAGMERVVAALVGEEVD
jgi:UDP-N-acetylmuramoyl-tripeptide--D-alanyl-D-alanine ligase